MLQEKKKDLDAEKQKKLLQRLLGDLAQEYPDLYYQSTTVIARQMRDFIAKGAKLNGEERGLVDGLTQRDIEVLLSLH